ncbi:MAG TPA: Nif3-like dinuclear metal center hexameric protein [Coriobacteriia bacterium]
MTRPTLGALVEALARAFPLSWAEPWDRVGLLAGESGAPVTRVFVTLDPTPEALARAVSAGAQVLLTHHPAFLDAPALLSAPGMAGVPHDAVRSGVALVAMHTNLDRAPAGAEALPLAVGLPAGEPLERSLEPLAVVVTYVPHEAAEAVRRAAAEAGAGRLGQYADCSFSSPGEGSFTPLSGSAPAVGVAGVPEIAEETRVEALCARADADRVAEAIRAAHPYDEPVVIVAEARRARGCARMGRLSQAPAGSTLGGFARTVGQRLGVRVTVWGDPESGVRVVATAPGSGRSLVADALTAGADVLLTGELRYHEALDALGRGLAVIEAGHDATEWPLVPVLAEAAARTPGLEAGAVIVDVARTAWWTTEGS